MRTEKDYYNWLLSIISETSSGIELQYDDAMEKINMMYNIPFRPVVKMDENRIFHVYETRGNHGWDYISKEPSVLEVLITIAISCEDEIMTNIDFGDRTAHWFWAMYSNLGLDDERCSLEDAEDIIFDFMNRNYDRYGHGSIFYTHYREHDFRTLDLWWQMQIWLTENYSDEIN